MADYDFGPGLDQAQAAYYHALAASQPSVFAIPGLQDAMGALPNRQGDPEAFARALSAHADANGYQIGNQYILDALGQKQAWDQAAAGVARRFDNQQPNSAIPPFSSAAKDYEAADATGRNVALGLLGAGSPGIAAGIAGAYAQPHAEQAYSSFREGDYGSAAGQALTAAGIGATGLLPLHYSAAAARADPNMLRIMIGEAAGEDAAGLIHMARKLEEKGASREEIWQATSNMAAGKEGLVGAYKGVDGKWRVEMDDSAAHATFGGNVPQPRTLGEGFANPNLYARFPELESMRLGGGPRPDAGVYRGGSAGEDAWIGLGPASSSERAGGTISHELQHHMQNQFGFAKGTNWREAINHAPEDLVEAHIQRELPKIRAEIPVATNYKGELQSPEEMEEVYRTIAGDRAKWSLYNASAGEVEANLVANRMGLSPAERMARPPWLDYYIPEKEQWASQQASGEAATAGRAPVDMSIEAVERRAKETATREMQRRLRNARNTDPANIVNRQKAGGEVQSIFMAPRDPPQAAMPDYSFWKGDF